MCAQTGCKNQLQTHIDSLKYFTHIILCFVASTKIVEQARPVLIFYTLLYMVPVMINKTNKPQGQTLLVDNSKMEKRPVNK